MGRAQEAISDPPPPVHSTRGRGLFPGHGVAAGSGKAGGRPPPRACERGRDHVNATYDEMADRRIIKAIVKA